MKFIITTLLLLATTLKIDAQFFETKRIHKDIKSIKGKYFNGTGGGGYWTHEFLDSLGRIRILENYQKKRLFAKSLIEYNVFNDKIRNIELFSVNNTNKVDTNRVTRYKYDENQRIIYQIVQYSNKYDSTKTELLSNDGDSILIYLETSFHFLPKKDSSWTNIVYNTLYYNKDQLIKKWVSKNANSTEIKQFWYYPNGKLKRRKIERIPKYEIKPTYTGGPGSDDQK